MPVRSGQRGSAAVEMAGLLATVAAAMVFGVLYVVTKQLGFGFEDLPQIVPDFD